MGIGTSYPTAKLEVAGQIKITGGSPGNGKVLVSDPSGLATWQSYAPIAGVALSGSFWRLDGSNISSVDFFGTTNAEDIRFRTNNTQRMVLDTAGNLGLGTASPSSRLSVVGDIFLSGGYLKYYPNGVACLDGQVLGWNDSLGRWICTTRAQGIT